MTLRDATSADAGSASAPPSNQALAAALRAARWTPRDLVRALNPRLEAAGQPTLHLTAGRAWLNGTRPRSATVRRLAATVLTEATGEPFNAADLWGEPAAGGATAEKTATDDLVGRRSVADVLATATAWTATEPQEQAILHPAGDSQLLSAVWDATRQSPLRTAAPGTQEQVLPAFVDVLEGHLGRLRRLDDTAGGGALSQRYVRIELAGVLDLVRSSSYTTDVGTRLLATASGMAQLSGWMAFDADLNAAAQRYQLLAIRLARAAGDTTTVANVLGMLAYQHAATGKPAAALRYAEAAVDHTARSSPVVRARAWGRMATAHAAAGDISAFRDATDRCRTLLEHRRDDDPPSLYYFTPEQVSAEAGHALVELAATNPAHTRRLLAEATTLLSPLTDHGPTSGFPRSALLHGIHLAHAHLLARDPDATAATLLQLADRVPDVQSIRCRNLLRRIRRSAGARMRAPDGARALTAVDRALSAS
ncbi:hypothetical protein OG906_38825 (plasmid) [Streptomyces sp. NBC_01426]|uniref:hypothetical protein n=1 Tax=Streptomyces sp. NBC_01426 TaxID=2975866 RepID=UPI002E34D4FE|nr:hypothetical protein [Streptomyces sp. NBC_01426]